MDYLYDHAFDGFLTACAVHFQEKRASGIFPETHYQYRLGEETKQIETDPKRASAFYHELEERFSPDLAHRVGRAFLSNHPDKENLLLAYLNFGYQYGRGFDALFTHPAVEPVHTIAAAVEWEAARFLGLIRFQEIKGILYAAFSPDNAILGLLTEHFLDRLHGEPWIIHDTKRNMAVICNGQRWRLVPFKRDFALTLPREEMAIQACWRGYFTHIAIPARKNPRLQAQYMPRRYWKDLIEVNKAVFR
jgi:probable DNA metabolism protein